MTERTFITRQALLVGIACALLLITAFFAGCTSSSTPQTATPAATVAATPAPAPQPVATTATQAPATVTTTSTPKPVYTASPGNLVVYTAASLSGASTTIGPSFTAAYPGTTVAFDHDGTQALKTQVENGA